MEGFAEIIVAAAVGDMDEVHAIAKRTAATVSALSVAVRAGVGEA